MTEWVIDLCRILGDVAVLTVCLSRRVSFVFIDGSVQGINGYCGWAELVKRLSARVKTVKYILSKTTHMCSNEEEGLPSSIVQLGADIPQDIEMLRVIPE